MELWRPGITPACAGTTRPFRRPSCFPWDHPRVCGNHIDDGNRVTQRAGSPPRVREPPASNDVYLAQERITPACAGTTNSRICTGIIRQDHPRVCGNHNSGAASNAHNVGSPPRVREPPPSSCTPLISIRITPACAGTTRVYARETVLDQDHPRVCGNHNLKLME